MEGLDVLEREIVDFLRSENQAYTSVIAHHIDEDVETRRVLQKCQNLEDEGLIRVDEGDKNRGSLVVVLDGFETKLLQQYSYDWTLSLSEVEELTKAIRELDDRLEEVEETAEKLDMIFENKMKYSVQGIFSALQDEGYDYERLIERGEKEWS